MKLSVRSGAFEALERCMELASEQRMGQIMTNALFAAGKSNKDLFHITDRDMLLALLDYEIILRDRWEDL